MFTGLLGAKRSGEYPYLTIGEDGTGGEGSPYCGRPRYGRLGREIPFADLPEAHRAAVLDAYRGLWGL